MYAGTRLEPHPASSLASSAPPRPHIFDYPLISSPAHSEIRRKAQRGETVRSWTHQYTFVCV